MPSLGPLEQRVYDAIKERGQANVHDLKHDLKIETRRLSCITRQLLQKKVIDQTKQPAMVQGLGKPRLVHLNVFRIKETSHESP